MAFFELFAVWGGVLVSIVASIAASILAFKLANREGTSIGGPRDIRAPKPLLERLVEVGFDWISPIGNPQSTLSKVFSTGRKDPRFCDETAIFKTKLGWRLGILPMIALLMAVTFSMVIEDGNFAAIDWYVVMAVTSFSIWITFYVFAFRVEVRGSELRSMGTFFNFNTYDLAKLREAQDLGDSYVLHFDCGARVPIPRYVEGHSTLKELVIHALNTNGR